MSNWSRKTILIVGGAGGLGRAIAQVFGAAGANIMIADQCEGNPQANTTFVSCDVRQPKSCSETIVATLAQFGRLDCLVNAAGVWVEGETASMTEDHWDLVMDVNLKGTFFMCSSAIPELIKTRGQIINIASDAGLIGNAGAAIYCASKGGVVLLTKALALELAPQGIRVNAICPCDIETPMLARQAEVYGGGDPKAYRAALYKNYPQGAATRFATPQEIAKFIFAIASPDFQPLTGAALSIDFGTTAGR